jgi:hypothetical protein
MVIDQNITIGQVVGDWSKHQDININIRWISDGPAYIGQNIKLVIY